MFFTSPSSTITPAMVSVAMSRSDSRDSNYSIASSVTDGHQHFVSAPMTVSYSTSPVSYMTRTTSNTSSSSTSSPRRASSSTQRRESSSQWIGSPYRSCQLRAVEEPSSYLSDDDLLYIAPQTSQPRELPIESIATPTPKRELTTEEQIAMLRQAQEKDQEQELVHLQQQRRQAAAAAQKAVRFADQKTRRPSTMRRRTTVKKGMNQLSH